MRPVQEELAAALEEATGYEVIYERCGSTLCFEADCFELSCVVTQESFEIRNIACTQQGIGRKVVEALHVYCDDNDVSVFASCVKSSAVGFWYKMGYIEGAEYGEFFRVA